MEIFRYVCRLNRNTPAVKAIYYYFATPPKSEKFIGLPRETIVTTLNRDIRRLNRLLGQGDCTRT